MSRVGVAITYLIVSVVLGVATAQEAQVREALLEFRPTKLVIEGGSTIIGEAASITVPESRSKQTNSTVQLALVRFRNIAIWPGTPIVYLAGGPGTSGISNARTIYPVIEALRQ